MKNKNLIRAAMMFAVKDVTGKVLREATVQSMIDDFKKQSSEYVFVTQSELLIEFMEMIEGGGMIKFDKTKLLNEFKNKE